MDAIRLKLVSYFNDYENYFMVDSMPLEVCKLSRSICLVKGIFQSIDFSPASVYDVNYLKDCKRQISDRALIGIEGIYQ